MTVRLGRGEDIYELLKVASLNGLLGESSSAVESLETAADVGFPHGASGADVWLPARYPETGGTSSPHGVGGIDVWIPAHWTERGAGVSPHAGSGADVFILTPIASGSASSPHGASGADVLTHIGFWPTTFPATPILDDFNRADGLMGPNWAIYPNDYYLKIDTNQVVSGRGPGYGGEMYYTHAFGPDAEIYITCVSIVNSASSLIKIGNDPLTKLGGYVVNYTRDDTLGDTISLSDEYAYYLGLPYTLGTVTVDYAPGDAIGIRAVGTKIKVYYKPAGGAWVEIISTDVSAFAYIRGSGVAVIDVIDVGALDDFGGGPLIFSTNISPAVYDTITPLSTNTTLDSSMHVVMVSSGATITLPNTSAYVAIEFIIVNVDSSPVTVNPDGGQYISGAASVTLNQWDSIRVVSGSYASQDWVRI
jgi:hypothetical protein